MTISFDETYELKELLRFGFSFNDGDGSGIASSRSSIAGRIIVNDGDDDTLPSGPPSSGGPVPGGVPEPSTWALMLAGFGAVGIAMRRARARLRPRIA